MKRLFWVVAGLLGLMGAALLYTNLIANPRVAETLRNDPMGARAGEVMLLTLPSGRELPVNYLQEPGVVFAGADGPWWRELRDGAEVQMLIRGERLDGTARAVLDDPAYTRRIFARLRPTAPDWLPDWLNGKLIEIRVSPITVRQKAGVPGDVYYRSSAYTSFSISTPHSACEMPTESVALKIAR